MTFKPKIWQPIAVVLSAVNLVAVGFAAGAAEPYHAAVHAALALGLGLWAQRLRGRLPPSAEPGELQSGLEDLQFEVSNLRADLNEMQERLDFTERVLAQPREK
ncbi:MAG TPA: hypothetical protein VMS62_06315 [Gemmatimonadales bacterium]|jgi:hypothetical protein|nr:hypothetical protein [Gemmatimonadales bacterium]